MLSASVSKDAIGAIEMLFLALAFSFKNEGKKTIEYC